jgi:hypothetical protein
MLGLAGMIVAQEEKERRRQAERGDWERPDGVEQVGFWGGIVEEELFPQCGLNKDEGERDKAKLSGERGE